jgi:hypothetical protein
MWLILVDKAKWSGAEMLRFIFITGKLSSDF